MGNLIKTALVGIGLAEAALRGEVNSTFGGCTNLNSTDYCAYDWPGRLNCSIPISQACLDSCYKAFGCCEDNSTVTQHNNCPSKKDITATVCYLIDMGMSFAGLLGFCKWQHNEGRKKKISTAAIWGGLTGLCFTILGNNTSIGAIGGMLAGSSAGFFATLAYADKNFSADELSDVDNDRNNSQYTELKELN
jgi:hypothetical protein